MDVEQMSRLKDIEKKYWEAYVRTLPMEMIGPIVRAEYAGSPEISAGLLNLYLEGKKSAGSSVLEDFLSVGDPVPQVGDYWILLKGGGEPGCILRTDKIILHKFNDVPVEVAVAEGEGDLSLNYWRRVHSQLWEPQIANWGLAKMEDATVLTEFFSLVHR
jgi:uncharacterized protein YhfF